ncbi:FtsX-like permease family protein [Listeria floridensis]|uniref:FtsX-like permease family protein n=1 Tax=Listeria floridensis TaxID=1494962 RepID=UPI001F4C7B17|nr:FtsX-like permease family protein [Listeria floridensis]
MKRRKRELGLYLLLGLRKSQISVILVIENLLVYCASLITGILSGIFFSKLFSMLLFWIVDLRVNTAIILSGKAVFDTIMIFAIVMAVTSFYAVSMVYRYSMLRLFQTGDREKNTPRGSVCLTLLGFGLIGFGYYLALENIETSAIWQWLRFFRGFGLILICVVVGTWLVIRFSMPLGLRFFHKRKAIYYYGTNLLTITSMRSRVKRNANTLAMIAVLSATTLTIIGALSSFYSGTIDDVKNENPSSYQFLNLTPEKQDEVERIIRRSSGHSLNYQTESSYVSAAVHNPTKRMPYEFYSNGAQFSFISEREFSRLNRIEGHKNKAISGLEDGEAVFVGRDSFRAPEKRRDRLKKASLSIIVGR